MSSKNKDRHDSPKGTAKGKERGKDAIARSATTSSSGQVELGKAMTGSMKTEDVHRIISIQNKSLKNFAKTNELLGKFNDFSSSKYDVLQHMFLQHTRLLTDLKKDLTNVFLRIRRLKVRLQKQYPEAFEGTFNLRQDLENRLEQEDAIEPTYVSSKTEKNTTKKGKTKVKKENLEDKGTMLIKDEITALQTTEVGEINNDLNSKVKHDKIHTIDETELTENLENCDVSLTNNKVEHGGVSEDEMSSGSDEHIQSEVKIIENAKEANGSTDQVKCEEKGGTQVITGDMEDFQGINNSTIVQNTSGGVIDWIYEGINDHERIEGGPEEPSGVDNGCPISERIEEDLEETMGSSKDIDDCQRIQGGPELEDNAPIHSSEETAKDISG